MKSHTRVFVGLVGVTLGLAGVMLVLNVSAKTWHSIGGTWLICLGVACIVVYIFGENR